MGNAYVTPGDRKSMGEEALGLCPSRVYDYDFCVNYGCKVTKPGKWVPYNSGQGTGNPREPVFKETYASSQW